MSLKLCMKNIKEKQNKQNKQLRGMDDGIYK